MRLRLHPQPTTRYNQHIGGLRMQLVLHNWPFKAPVAGFRRFSVDEYHKLIEIGMLTENDRVELLEGYLVEKMPHDPLHDGTLQKLNRRILKVLPAGWDLRIQMATTLGRSEPEPDGAVVRDVSHGYVKRHPGPKDIGVVIEVANTTLDSDRADKLMIYASTGLPVYWIVNVVDRQIEVYGQPKKTGYRSKVIYKRGDSLPLKLDGTIVASIPVDDLLP
jgi:Uma2 family endonuclease